MYILGCNFASQGYFLSHCIDEYGLHLLNFRNHVNNIVLLAWVIHSYLLMFYYPHTGDHQQGELLLTCPPSMSNSNPLHTWTIPTDLFGTCNKFSTSLTLIPDFSISVNTSSFPITSVTSPMINRIKNTSFRITSPNFSMTYVVHVKSIYQIGIPWNQSHGSGIVGWWRPD